MSTQHASRPRIIPALALGSLSLFIPLTHAAELEASDGVANVSNYFGYFSGISGSNGVIGAAGNGVEGKAYIYRNLSTATGVVTENLKLDAADGTAADFFGWNVNISGSNALINAPGKDSSKGAAYLFHGVDTATGTLTQSVKLTASDGAAGDQFANSGAIDGNIAILGANTARIGGVNRGAAYVFRNLDTAPSAITESVKLIASDGASGDSFGIASGISGSIGIVSAFKADIAGSVDQGAIYVYRGLDTATGTLTEAAKLIASDGVGGASTTDNFGNYVSLSGTMALVSANQDDDKGSNSGSVYLFKNLDTATGNVNESAKLLASDGGGSDSFGISVSLSVNNAIIGAYQDDDKANNAGAAYIFTNLDAATGTVNQAVKVTASNGASNDNLGQSVAIDGDNFLVTAGRGDGVAVNTGNAYSGSVSSLTTLDSGNTSRSIDGISFVSQTDWIIGKTTANNQVTLTTGDNATVRAAGKAIYIGQEGGADSNRLIIAGAVSSTQIFIGAEGLTSGNVLQLETGVTTVNIGTISLADANLLSIQGDYSDPTVLLAYLGLTELQVWDEAQWENVTAENFNQLVTSTFDSGTGYTSVRSAPNVIPEPSASLLILGSLGTFMLIRNRRR